MSLRLSLNTILFDQRSNKENLKLHNISDHKIIFKVKVNNIQLFKIFPGKGYIQPSSSVDIEISLKKVAYYEAKLLILYAPLEQAVNGETYDVIWSSLDKKKIIQEIVLLNIKPGVRSERSSEFKHTDSPELEPLAENSKSSHSLSSRHITENPQPRPIVQKSSTSVFQSIVATQRTFSLTNNRLQRSQIHNLEKQLQKEKQNNQTLVRYCLEQRQNLTEREKKLRHFQGISQKHINESMPIEEEPLKLNLCNVGLLMLICLFFGFLMARSSRSDVEL